MLQAVERERETIKESVWELHDKGYACKISMLQGSRLRTGGYATARVGWKVTVGVTIHDRMFDLRQNGVGAGHLRHKLRARFGTICHQESIDGPELGGMVEFEFKRCYKTPRASRETKLVHLRFQQLIRAQSVAH